jgi:hypothetical protein
MALRTSDSWTFKGTTNVHHDHYNINLLYGLMGFLRWASLEAQAFQNVDHTYASGMYGGDFSRLRPVSDPNYTDGQVWEGFRGDWIWETGSAASPAINSGVYVDGAWAETASETGVYSHYVDFPQGRVVFDSPVATTSVIKADFAHRIPTIVKASEHWLKELAFDSWSVERSDYLSSGSGMWDQPYAVRRQLPCLGVQLVNRRGLEPYELGGSQWVHQTVDLYVVAQDDHFVDQWVDVLTLENDRTVWLPNRKRMQDDAGYPHDLDYRGSPVSNPMTYPQLIQPTGEGGFGWTNAEWGDTVAEKISGLPDGLFATKVQASFAVVLGYI